MSQIYIIHVGSEDVMKLLASEYEAENWTPFGETYGKSGEDGVPKEHEEHVQCDRLKPRRTRAKTSLAKNLLRFPIWYHAA